MRNRALERACYCHASVAAHSPRIDILGTEVTASADVQVFSVFIVGRLTGEVALGIVDHFYPEVGARNILWDMTAAKIELTETDLPVIARHAAVLLDPAPHRKTACVVASPEACVPLWRYVNAAFVAGVPAEYSVFVGINKARDWLAHS